ncbi:tRNA (guanosine(37)-N1)-methyltransferase TrmD [Bartonella sp. DGB1]|uniref:tRNA (guanosine(37)-N1)-methyltransferase TrmD n=1 Tax=Bartonella sp. DGB1 TaxID=3239807 RepID=UPI003524CB00
MSFAVDIITLYPEMFPGYLNYSLAGKAKTKNIWNLNIIPIRDFAIDKHRNVDDTPAGGGAGMVMRADILAKAIDSNQQSNNDNRPLILLTPRGKPLSQQRVKELSQGTGIRLICGRFEGIDQRLIDSRDIEEISIGDYILSGGEGAALILLDAIIRLLPGVMGNKKSAISETFEENLLEYPQYTRPILFEDKEIPKILLSGDHKKIAEWRQQMSFKITKERRPDLWEKYKKQH